jgi:ring-1,2-phenylacetyl-CoA epoxidase subunit PaaE
VMTPEGHFKIKTDHMKTRDHVFFAAGSGITPIMSMIQTALEEEPKSTCYLFYGSRDESNIIFKDQLDALVSKYEDQLIVSYILSKPLEKSSGGLGGFFGKKSFDWKGLRGRIDAQSCKNFLNEVDPKNTEAQYYLCGPGDFIINVENYLKAQGKDQKTIHKEFFTTISTKEASPNQSAEGSVKVTLKGETFEINVTKGKTILETLVELKKDPPYSCTSGACSTCMAKVTSGEVTMDSCYALEDDEIAAGYILTCQAHPKTGQVALTYDV